jgi:hypothetical protein
LCCENPAGLHAGLPHLVVALPAAEVPEVLLLPAVLEHRLHARGVPLARAAPVQALLQAQPGPVDHPAARVDVAAERVPHEVEHVDVLEIGVVEHELAGDDAAW